MLSKQLLKLYFPGFLVSSSPINRKVSLGAVCASVRLKGDAAVTRLPETPSEEASVQNVDQDSGSFYGRKTSNLTPASNVTETISVYKRSLGEEIENEASQRYMA